MAEPVFLNVICPKCNGAGVSSLAWPNNACYPCGGQGKILRPYVLADSPWIAGP